MSQAVDQARVSYNKEKTESLEALTNEDLVCYACNGLRQG